MSTLTDFEREAIRIAMLKMFEPGGYLSICTIDNCLKLARIHPPQRTYDALNAMHCVHWSTMTPHMRQATAQTILGLFDEPGLDLPQLHASFLPEPPKPDPAAPLPDKPSIFKRLMGKVPS